MKKLSKTLNIIIVTVISLSLPTSCQQEMPESVSKGVIEGKIDSGGYPEVFFTASLSPSENGIKISEKIIRWGVVKIYDGDEEYILTGGPARNKIPPYHYYSVDFKGIPGHEYRITAEYENLYVESVCRMPEPTSIDEITFQPIEGIDTLRSCTLHFTAPRDCPAYYIVQVTGSKQNAQTNVATMSATMADTPGEKIAIPIQLKTSQTAMVKDKSPLFAVGQQLGIDLCRVTREVYDFWKSYDEYLMFNGTALIKSSKDITGNVEGGYGIWSAQGVSSQTVTVK